MKFFDDLQRGFWGLLMWGLIIVAIVQVARNAGGVARVLESLFEGGTGVIREVARA